MAPTGSHGSGGTMMQAKHEEVYWSKTMNLMYVMMGLWLFFSFVIHFFVVPLNAIRIAGFPLGFYMAAQGSLIAFVVMLFWFARRQDQIDRECGVNEEE